MTMPGQQDNVKETDARLGITNEDGIRDAIITVIDERRGRSLTTTDVFKLACDKLGYFIRRDVIYSWLLGLHWDGWIAGLQRGNGRWKWSSAQEMPVQGAPGRK